MLSLASAHPIRSLTAIFLLWKVGLVVLALLSPGHGYDTSTDILFALAAEEEAYQIAIDGRRNLFDLLLLKLTRWDALFFSKISERGYVNEQEWAFSWVYTRLISTLVKFITTSHGLRAHIIVAISIVNIAHFLSVITLYYLTLVVEGKKEHSKLAFVAAFLHVLTPAGIFLCAPYAEGFFSFANFLGMLLYASYYMSTKQTGDLSLKQGTLVILSGVSFGLAAATRTNGVLSGMLFASDFFISLRGFVSSRRSRYLGYMAVSVLAGLLTSAGLVIPQALAYKLYCVNSPSGLLTRPWCKSLPPSIYSWVQSYYWEVGFLRYWTLPNLPLFFLAAPMLLILAWTALETFKNETSFLSKFNSLAQSPQIRSGTKTASSSDLNQVSSTNCLRMLALPQLALVILATSSFHVQIINRIASGYPLWYIYLSWTLLTGVSKRSSRFGSISLRWMVIYGIIQGGLFASFLPPA